MVDDRLLSPRKTQGNRQLTVHLPSDFRRERNRFSTGSRRSARYVDGAESGPPVQPLLYSNGASVVKDARLAITCTNGRPERFQPSSWRLPAYRFERRLIGHPPGERLEPEMAFGDAPAGLLRENTDGGLPKAVLKARIAGLRRRWHVRGKAPPARTQGRRMGRWRSRMGSWARSTWISEACGHPLGRPLPR